MNGQHEEHIPGLGGAGTSSSSENEAPDSSPVISELPERTFILA